MAPFWAPFWERFGSTSRHYTPFWSTWGANWVPRSSGVEEGVFCGVQGAKMVHFGARGPRRKSEVTAPDGLAREGVRYLTAAASGNI